MQWVLQKNDKTSLLAHDLSSLSNNLCLSVRCQLLRPEYYTLMIFVVYNYRLFEIAPDLLQLFPFKGAAVTPDNELLKKHGVQVMESIDAAIGMLNNPEELKETLIDLGIVHHMKDVKVESFAVSIKINSVCVCAGT